MQQDDLEARRARLKRDWLLRKYGYISTGLYASALIGLLAFLEAIQQMNLAVDIPSGPRREAQDSAVNATLWVSLLFSGGAFALWRWRLRVRKEIVWETGPMPDRTWFGPVLGAVISALAAVAVALIGRS